MSSIWGRNLHVSIFGESHGNGIGVVLDGFPAGLPLDMVQLASEMARRKPGTGKHTTTRSEAVQVEILSGVYQGRTTGAPLCGIIRNTDTKSGDYSELSILPRPGHADYTGQMRNHGFNDPRGGGHFSGRLTAPLVFAGEICRQYLESRGITIGSHIQRVRDVYDVPFDPCHIAPAELETLRTMLVPVNDRSCAQEILDVVEDARVAMNSVGGIVETAVIGLVPGLGSPMFANVEARLSSMLFSIPAVKGVEFGDGFAMAGMTGLEANDAFFMEGAHVRTRTNHPGGLNGGITNGMPVVFRVVVKPTASIFLEQQTVNLREGVDATLQLKDAMIPALSFGPCRCSTPPPRWWSRICCSIPTPNRRSEQYGNGCQDRWNGRGYCCVEGQCHGNG
jgi:chorismate synthase